MLKLIGGFLMAVLEFMITVAFSALSWLLRLLWPVWVVIVIFGFLALNAQSAQAGWFDWLWGSDTARLERSAEIAQEAARVTSASTMAQAEQASAQAAQNARVAELLSHLSEERQGLAGYLTTLAEIGVEDSQWAAALSATGPIMISAAVLLVAGLALWSVTRTGPQDQTELSDALDFLAMEVAAYEPAHASSGALLPSSSSASRVLALMNAGDDFPDEDNFAPPHDDAEDPNDRLPF
jgi:hypothetical protein